MNNKYKTRHDWQLPPAPDWAGGCVGGTLMPRRPSLQTVSHAGTAQTRSIFLFSKIIEPIGTFYSRCTASCITDNKHDISLANLSLSGTAHLLSRKSNAARLNFGCSLHPVFLSNRLRVQHVCGWVLISTQSVKSIVPAVDAWIQLHVLFLSSVFPSRCLLLIVSAVKEQTEERNVWYSQPCRLGTPSSQGENLGGEAPDTGDSHPSDTEAASSLSN